MFVLSHGIQKQELSNVLEEVHPVCFKLNIQILRDVHHGVNSRIKYSKGDGAFHVVSKQIHLRTCSCSLPSVLLGKLGIFCFTENFIFFKHRNSNKIRKGSGLCVLSLLMLLVLYHYVTEVLSRNAAWGEGCELFVCCNFT